MNDAARSNLREAEYLALLCELRDRAWPSEVPRELRYPCGEIPLSDYLRRWAKVQPDKTAIIFYGTELSYSELDSLSDKVARLLASLGIKHGDRVAVFMPNCPQFLIAFFGILKLGAVLVPVNPLYMVHEFVHQINDSGAEVVIALDQNMEIVRASSGQTKLREYLVTSFAEVLPAEPTLPLPPNVQKPRLPCADAIDLLPALRAIPAQPPFPQKPG